MSNQDVIQYLVFFVLPALTAFVFSDVLEQQTWFHKLSSQQKSQFWLVTSVVLGAGFQLVLQSTSPSTLTSLGTLITLVIHTVNVYSSGTFYHEKLDNTSTTSTPKG